MYKNKIFETPTIVLAIFVLIGLFGNLKGDVDMGRIIEVKVVEAVGEEVADKVLYDGYENYVKYEKREKYRDYKDLKKKYKKYKKKYGFKSSSERRQHRSAYKNYKKYKKNKSKYPQYAGLAKRYKKYKKYRSKYKPMKAKYKKVRKYRKYKKYDKDEYGKDEYKKYGTAKYKQGWVRYKKRSKKTQADLGGGALGPEITVGLFKFSKNDLKDGSFRVKANKDYVVKDMAGKSLGTIPAATVTKVRYDNDGKLKVDSSIEDILVDREVSFEALVVGDKDLIFEIVSPHIDCYSDNCNEYRGELKLRYSPESKKIWLINTLPLEQYVWGMGEITGTGDKDYNDTMTTAYRTYGYWKIKYSTKFASEGFKVNATPGNQLYFGHVWEEKHQRIKEAAQKTRGKLVMYDERIAIVPYSSWTDGRTRSFKEKWGSDNFPWCQSVADPYGKHPSKSYAELQADGNHMVGVSAHGALEFADDGWDYKKILKYYLKGISINQAY
jgi:hypothetical protein